MAHKRTPREAWVRAALEALTEGGPEAVRIEVLAKRLGVTKGGFYGYFEGRDQLLAEALDVWEREAAQAVIDEVEQSQGNAQERLRSLLASVKAREDTVRTEFAIREWARRDPAVAARLRRVDYARLGYVRELHDELTGDAAEAAARAAVTIGLWLAGHYMRFDTEGFDHDAVLKLVFDRMTGKAQELR
ncbi:TetR/AcrR family transcriptional regulator [Arthrobacter sp. ISL-72]|uniref:TetR/AcrR family transcriptional regulator n=1 Tax=Arthrobacter sp. ISL-72 TaxID=2819114 RepID=UPI001BE86979|nr:TetR/AcrR family transcriptional regulator [Arthrobacter sp. ISL-72]MBT2594274.1 TetR/AcrR family transcriptional regulator [Arthrobacter sp. ISL-72]